MVCARILDHPPPPPGNHTRQAQPLLWSQVLKVAQR